MTLGGVMRRPSSFLFMIVVLQLGVAGLSEYLYWGFFPDGDYAIWLTRHNYGYWVTLVALLYCWCWTDVADRRVALPKATLIVVPLLFPIGVPYYFFAHLPVSDGDATSRLGDVFCRLMRLCPLAGATVDV